MEKFIHEFDPPMVEQLPALYPELPDFMFYSRFNSLTRADNDLGLTYRIWFSKEPLEKDYKDGCTMIGQLSARLLVRRAQFVSELLPDCTEGEFDYIARSIPFVSPNTKQSADVSYSSAQEFLETSETFTLNEDQLAEDIVWYLRANVCLLHRAYKDLPAGLDLIKIIDDMTRIQESESIDGVEAARQALVIAGIVDESSDN